MHVSLSTRLHVCTVCVYVCLSISMNVCMFVLHMRVCMYGMYICMSVSLFPCINRARVHV